MLINKAHITSSPKLSSVQQTWFRQFNEEELVVMASVLHGARISASSKREKLFMQKLQAVYGLDAIQLSGEWDFAIKRLQLVIDLKSPGFDHNTPVDAWVKKYMQALPKEHKGIFVIQELPGMPLTTHWPVAKIESYGLQVMSETQFELEFL